MKFSGTRLRNLRKQAGYTQKELADKLELSRETVVAIENEHKVTIEALKMSVVQQWFFVCGNRIQDNDKSEFRSHIKAFFKL